MSRYSPRPRRGIPTRRRFTIRLDADYAILAAVLLAICFFGAMDYFDAVLMAGGK